MSNDQNDNSKQDHALAHLILGVSPLVSGDVGREASEEEIAILAEGRAIELLGQQRESQLRAQLASSPELYSQWLMLTDLLGETQTASQSEPTRVSNTNPTAAKSWLAGLLGLFNPLFSPGGVAIASITLAAIFGAYQLGQGHGAEEPTQLAHAVDGDPLAAKAQSGYAGEGREAASGIPRLAASFRCASDQTPGNAVCVSKTEDIQHWLIASGSRPYQAVAAPIQADRIIGLRISGNSVLIESELANAYVLSVFMMKTGNQLGLGEPVFQDSVVNGYFENIQLTGSGLSYDRMLSDGTREAVKPAISVQ